MPSMILIWLAFWGTPLPIAKTDGEVKNISSDIKLQTESGKLYKHENSYFPKQFHDNNDLVSDSSRFTFTRNTLVPRYGPKHDRKLFDDGKKGTGVKDEQTNIAQKPNDDTGKPQYDSQSYRIGLINNRSEIKGRNAYFQLQKKQQVKQFLRKLLTKVENNTNKKAIQESNLRNKPDKQILLNRTKRWEYYDKNYDWENGGADYQTEDSNQRKETKLEKFAKNWQKHALRFIFIFSFIMMFVCCCCAGCKKFFQRLCEVVMMHLREWRDLCLNRDPTYRMMRKHADEYGIQLDYDEYKRIKNAYDESLKKHGYSSVDLSGRK